MKKKTIRFWYVSFTLNLSLWTHKKKLKNRPVKKNEIFGLDQTIFEDFGCHFIPTDSKRSSKSTKFNIFRCPRHEFNISECIRLLRGQFIWAIRWRILCIFVSFHLHLLLWRSILGNTKTVPIHQCTWKYYRQK